MKLIIMLGLLSGCLVVETSGTPSEPGMYYVCMWTGSIDKAVRTDSVCGPQSPDTDYVVENFHPDPPADPGTEIRCEITFRPCILWREP